MAKATDKTTAATATEETTKTDIAVASAPSTGLVAAPSFMDAGDFEGMGFEGIDKDSFAIPFIQLLQKTSPLVDEDNAKYVKGAKAGMFYNTVNGHLYDGKTGVTIIPCSYKRSYVEWGGREADGGYKGEFTPEQIDEMVKSKEIIVIEGGLYRPDADGNVKDKKKANYFADTRSHYVIFVGTPVDGTEEDEGIAVLPLASTQTKASKTLMTLLQQKKVDTANGRRTPPSFANKVKMTTIAMQNAKGSWSGVKFDLDGLVDNQQLYDDAKAF